jgi:acyl transferase domain-containing protein
MARSEALMVDPQQRLLLEAGLELTQGAEAAGAAAAAGGDVGCYVGISTPDYADLKKLATPIGVYSATGGLLGWCC